jgi:hypothetical protein
MRSLTILAAVSVLAVGCGSPRRVVVEPAEVPGLKGDTWHVTGEPAPAPTGRPAGEAEPAPEPVLAP